MHIVLNAKPSRLTRKESLFQFKNEGEQRRLSPYQVSSITLARACLMSSDALLLAAEHDIPVLVLRKGGKPGLLLHAPAFGKGGKLHRAQAHFTESVAGTAWMIDRLQAAMDAQIHLLERWNRGKDKKQARLQSILTELQSYRERLEGFNGRTLREVGRHIRSQEGHFHKCYFKGLNVRLPKVYRFGKRSRRPAQDRFNAALNYAYGMLYNEVHLAILLAGLNAGMGFLHEERSGLPTLVLDVMEAYRPWMEVIVVDLCRKRELKESHVRPKDGGLWLTAGGRQLVIEAVEHMWHEKVRHRGKEADRRTHLREDMREMARHILNWYQQR